ncbi:YeaH/YhbH family protein [Ideonella paludis]|uniref:YeaH/YhbH family protein n=1 Tax=Ideonella paludis TaxID=1233411 RepID=UPI00363B5DEC
MGNRERFLKRYKDKIRDAVKRAVDGRGIRDLERGEEVHIPKKPLRARLPPRPRRPARCGAHRQQRICDGRPHRAPARRRWQGLGQGPGQRLGRGRRRLCLCAQQRRIHAGLFEDLALPRLLRTQLAEVPEYKTHRAGYSSDGTPNNLHIVRSMRGAYGRRLALGGEARRELRELEEKVSNLKRYHADDPVAQREVQEAQARIAELRARLDRIPFLDPIDLKFRSRVRVAVPSSKAVMFCLMDVSGSMDEQRKELSKRFFILLYLFLTRHYEKIELVFIRHHTQAQEVSEEDFFHARETGGTVVSSALELMDQIVRERYNPTEWNIYGAQASDGDNWHHDSTRCKELLINRLLPACRYYAYVQVAEEEQNLWEEYASLVGAQPNFAMRKATEASDIYPVFRDLFKKEGATA